ncbi:cyclin [Holotrichia oblita]|uniref:Cyclin n=1 Tax=Holotrichia oblita TaxID=644536 RepID=A0ACB9SK46_HOLOL|nr:cyclin [Holotrichia oblita]
MSSTKSEPPQSTVKNGGKPYGKIILTLKNQLLPEDKLQTTPSQIDGLDSETETDLRIYGCELIQTAGILLKLPQVAMATGQVLLQRFYYSKSLVRHPVDQTAMACVCLASKIEEAPRRVRDVINVFSHIRQVNLNKGLRVGQLKTNFQIIVMYLQVLGYERNQNLMQFSWNYMNDSLRTDVFVRYQPESIACACIYLTARKLKLPLPKNPAWYTLFGVTETEIRDICIRIMKLYNRPKANIDHLEKKVEELCKKYQDAKMKARGNSGNNTPNNNSPSSPSTQKNTGAHNAWGGFISRSGSHIAPPVSEKRSRSRSPSHSPAPKHHKRPKKHPRSRSRSPTRPTKKSRKHRSSYSRSRSESPVKVARKNRDKKRSPSNDRENKNDRYIDRYDKYEKNDRYDKERYKEDRYNDKERYDEKDRKDRYEKNEKKYERDDKYKEDKYKEDSKYKDEKYKEDRYKEEKYREDKDSNRYKKSKHRDEDRDREKAKDKRR